MCLQLLNKRPSAIAGRHKIACAGPRRVVVVVAVAYYTYLDVKYNNNINICLPPTHSVWLWSHSIVARLFGDSQFHFHSVSFPQTRGLHRRVADIGGFLFYDFDCAYTLVQQLINGRR